MTYFDAVSIQQDLIVAMQYAGVLGKAPVEALKETAGKYSNEQYAKAFKVICAKLKEEKEDLRKLFLLAVQSKNINLEVISEQ